MAHPLLWALVALAFAAAPARASMVFTTPAFNATGAADGAAFNVTSPACATAAVLHRCNVVCGDPSNCPVTQTWDSAAAPHGTNATRCGFVFHLPPGEQSAQWLLVAVAQCAE